MSSNKIYNRFILFLFKSNALYNKVATENWFFMRFAYVACCYLKIRCVLPLTVKGHKLKIRPCSPDLEVALTSLGEEYDPLLQYGCNERCLILDAGGYIGTSAIRLSELFPFATVISVEPHPENYVLLERNTTDNENIIPLNCALVPEGSGEVIGLYDRKTGQWGATIIGAPADRPSSFIQNSSTCSLQKILEEFGHDQYKLIKLDIEGAEKYLFDSRFDWRKGASLVFVELHDSIMPGCTDAFLESQRDKVIIQSDGEKYLAISKNV